jgi:hypothetical protein
VLNFTKSFAIFLARRIIERNLGRSEYEEDIPESKRSGEEDALIFCKATNSQMSEPTSMHRE